MMVAVLLMVLFNGEKQNEHVKVKTKANTVKCLGRKVSITRNQSI